MSASLVAVLASVVLASDTPKQGVTEVSYPIAPSNVLILLADDVGIDQLASYGVGQNLPRTPNLDRLAKRGVVFRNAWANPVCSPTRAALQTGRHGFRTGIGTPVSNSVLALPLSEITLPKLLDAGTGGSWSHALIGKWHLGNLSSGGMLNPNLHGWSYFAGPLGNLGAAESYYSWTKVLNGVPRHVTTYATTDQVDDTLDWIADAPEPWLCMLSFSAPHYPLHAPPPELSAVELEGLNPHDVPKPFYNAMLEALDTELGRLLEDMDPAVRARTTVVFLGDNGTVSGGVSPPFDPAKAKWTLYEGGVRVPLIVDGPLVHDGGREVDSLVHAVDLFATVAELAGVDPFSVLPPGRKLDSRSLMPFLRDDPAPLERDALFSEVFSPNGLSNAIKVSFAMRGARYKLIADWITGATELYDLESDPFETVNLAAGSLAPELRAVHNALFAAIVELVATP